MKPDYYVRQRTITTVTRKGKKRHVHKRTVGEHVMTYKVFKAMSVHKVLTLIGR